MIHAAFLKADLYPMSGALPIEIHYAAHRLLFHHPFGTAHGTRDGTDAVFIRLRRGNVVGYGEATIPPYLNDRAEDVVAVVQWLEKQNIDTVILKWLSGSNAEDFGSSKCARAAITSAYFDLVAKERGTTVSNILKIKGKASPRAMYTIGLMDPSEIPSRLKDMPEAAVIKVKLGGQHDRETLEMLLRSTDLPLFLDGNQGFRSVSELMKVLDGIDADRIIGLEQPFGQHDTELHVQLKRIGFAKVYGDESIQGMDELAGSSKAFDGVNLKLMKCGGLDRAVQMAMQAKELGLSIMLGCMSESSLGCSTMAQLEGMADLVDLDGPWLLKNDPFDGLGMKAGKLTRKYEFGSGAELRLDQKLNWIK